MGAAESKQFTDQLSTALGEERINSILHDKKFVNSLKNVWETVPQDDKKLALSPLGLNEKQNQLRNGKTNSTANLQLHPVVTAGTPIWSAKPETFFCDKSFTPEFSGNFLRALHLCGSRSYDEIALSKIRQKVLAVAIHRLKTSFSQRNLDWDSLLDEVTGSLDSSDQGAQDADQVRKTWSAWAKLGNRLAVIADDIGSIGVLLVLPDEISDTKWLRLPLTADHPDRKTMVEDLKGRGILEAARQCCTSACCTSAFPSGLQDSNPETAAEKILEYIHSMQMMWVKQRPTTKERDGAICDDCRAAKKRCDPGHLSRKRRDRQVNDQGGGGKRGRTSTGQHDSPCENQEISNLTTEPTLGDGEGAFPQTGVDLSDESGLAREAGPFVPLPSHEDDVGPAGARGSLLSPPASQQPPPPQNAGVCTPDDSDPQPPQGQWNPINGQYRGPTHGVPNDGQPHPWLTGHTVQDGVSRGFLSPEPRTYDVNGHQSSDCVGMLLDAAKNLSPEGMFGGPIGNTLSGYLDFSDFAHWELDYPDPIDMDTV